MDSSKERKHDMQKEVLLQNNGLEILLYLSGEKEIQFKIHQSGYTGTLIELNAL